MKKFILVSLFMLALVFSFSSAFAEEVNVHFFWGQGCPHCGRVELLIDELEGKNTEVNFHKYEIYFNRSNIVLLTEFFDKYGVPERQRGVPVVFISDKYCFASRRT